MQVGVLFVCMGNICRSPTAEAVFKHRVAKVRLQDGILSDSAGAHDYHIGGPQRSELVLDMIEDAARGLLRPVRAQLPD